MSAAVELRREPLTAAEQTAVWQRLASDAALAGLPYKFETDLWGGLHLSPTQSRHARMVRKVCRLLEDGLGGEALTEVPLVTGIGVKVPDVAWCSPSVLGTHWSDTVLLHAPELCLEVISPSNSEPEMREKVTAYMAAGALEVWLVALDGAVAIFDGNGERNSSRFPLDPGRLGAESGSSDGD